MNTDVCNVEDINIPISQSVCRCLSLRLLRIGTASLSLDHAPCARMIWISTTFLILLRCKNSSYRLQQWICPCAVRINKSPCSNYYQLIHQISTLEKTKFCQHSILSSLMSKRLQQVRPVLWCCSVRELRSSWLSCLVFSGLSDAVEASTSGVLSLHRETKFIIGFDFAMTLSSLESFCVLFDITSEQSVELK